MKALVVFIIYLIMAGILTLLERKLIALTQSRVSNNKFSIHGLFQFFMDFVKLLSKTSLQGIYNKNYKQLNKVFIFFINNIILFFTISNVVNERNFSMFNIFLFIIFSIINICIKIFCGNYLKSYLSKYTMERLKLVFNILETLSSFSDYNYVLYFTLKDILSYLRGGELESYMVKGIIVILFVVLLGKSFRNPFDNVERESECLNSLFINSEGMDFSIWTLIEYVLIVNNVFYLVTLGKLVLHISWFICFHYSIFLLLLICFIRAISVRYKFNSLVMISLILIFIMSVILYVSMGYL